ncbi:hypothetical protein, partial [Klebsiella pneumoniae]|uniref:hypothetical protein n=1 Tax=Klebsiella pneumoniae TaxID=573 RepID=UPI001C9BADDC
LKMPAFEWVHVQLHQQKGMISLSPPTICNSAKKDATLRPFFHGFACRPATADSKYSSKCHPLETVR